jgi:hypothetical protein
MALELPSATVEEESGGVNPVDLPPDDVCVFIGPCSKGPLFQPFQFNNVNALASKFGCGPGVKSKAYALAKTGATGLFVRIPATSVAAYKSAVDKSDLTDPTLNPTVSGTPTDGFEVVILFTAGGVTGTTGISYKVSLDGGETFGSAVALGTGLTISPANTGLTITLVTGKNVSINDSFSFYTLPASSTILPQTTTRANSGAPSTATFTVSGAPEDAYEVLLEILTGGTVGTVGIVYRYSLDGGRTFTGRKQLGTANSIQLLDGTEDSGLDIGLGAGTLDAGDKLSFNTTGPGIAASDVNDAIEAVDDSPYAWSFIHVVGTCSDTMASSIGGELDNLEADETGATFTMSILSARDRSTGEDDIVWSNRLVTDWASFVNDRIAVGAGYARITCPITQRSNRRPIAWVLVPELIKREIQEDPGRKGAGALSSDVLIHDEDNQLAEHDARINSALHTARFVTLRTYKRQRGVFITRGNMMSDETSDISRIPLRRVMNKASEIFRQVMELQLENDLFANPAGVANPGALREEDAAIIDREIKTALEGSLTGQVSAVYVRVSRTDPVLTNGGKLSAEVRITGLAYVDSFKGKISYVNPKLAQLQEAA